MLAGEEDAAFGGDDAAMELEILARLEEGEGAAGEFVFVPHLAGADLEFFGDLRMDLGDIFEGLGDAVGVGEGAPALGVFGPGVAGDENAAAGLAAVIGVIDAADGEIGHGAAAEDSIVFFPESATALEEDFGGGIVVELTDGALLFAGERFQDFDMAEDGEGDGDDGVVGDDLVFAAHGVVVEGYVIR